jgi:hypothetical protein
MENATEYKRGPGDFARIQEAKDGVWSVVTYEKENGEEVRPSLKGYLSSFEAADYLLRENGYR